MTNWIDRLFAVAYFQAPWASPRTPPAERKRQAELIKTGQFPARWRRSFGQVSSGTATAADGRLTFVESGVNPRTFDARPDSVIVSRRVANQYGRIRRLVLQRGEQRVVLLVPTDHLDEILARLRPRR